MSQITRHHPCDICLSPGTDFTETDDGQLCDECLRKHHPELIEDAFKADDPFPLSARDFTPIDKLVSYAIRVGRFEAMIEAHGREVQKLVRIAK